MQEISIVLGTVENIKEFVGIVTSFDCDVDMKSGAYMIDAKSIMGIFSLDTSRPVTICIHSTDSAYVEKISQFVYVD